ncbi:unnamed protein product, partial [Prorocentrum cordatum]
EDSRLADSKYKRELDRAARELKAERQKAERLQAQLRRLEDERRLNPGDRPRSRPTSRSPSVDRARPPSRPTSGVGSRASSRAPSRAGSVASSRDRTPSPSGLGRSGSAGSRGPEPRSWASQRSNSPGARRGIEALGGGRIRRYDQVQHRQWKADPAISDARHLRVERMRNVMCPRHRRRCRPTGGAPSRDSGTPRRGSAAGRGPRRRGPCGRCLAAA